MDNDLIAMRQISIDCKVSYTAISHITNKMGFADYVQTIGKKNFLPKEYADKIIAYYHDKNPKRYSDDFVSSMQRTSDETIAVTITLNSDELALIKYLTPSPFTSVSDYCRRLIHADIKENASKYKKIVELKMEAEKEIQSLIRDMGLGK